MTYHEAFEAAARLGIPGRWTVDKRPSRFEVGREFGGKFGPRRRVIAKLGPVSGRPVTGERGYYWFALVNV